MNKLEDIKETIVKNYRKNIEIKDVKFYESILWDTLIVIIIDNNKKHFKNKTLRTTFLYNDKIKLKKYVEELINSYIDDQIGDKIRELHAFEIVSEYKKEMLGDK